MFNCINIFMFYKIMKKEIFFVDAQEMHRKFPVTFKAPSPEELDELKAGDSVKISCDKERFWVTIKNIDGDKISGTVDNSLVNTHIHGLRYKDTVTFEKKNIYNIF